MATRLIKTVSARMTIVFLIILCMAAPVFASPNWITVLETPTAIYQVDKDTLAFSGADADTRLDLWMKLIDKNRGGTYLVAHYLVRENNLAFILRERTAYTEADQPTATYKNPADTWITTTPTSPIGSIATRLFEERRKGLEPGASAAAARTEAAVPAIPDGPQVRAPITVKADPQLPAGLVDKVKKVVAATEAFFAQKHGLVLAKPVDVVLLANQEAYRKTLIELMKLPPEVADKFVKHTNGVSQWHIASHALQQGAPDWAIYLHIGHELTHTYQRQLATAAPPGKITWLWEGMADIIPSQLMETHGVQTMAESRKGWLEVVRRSPVHPELKSLLNQDQWFKAQDHYGGQVVTKLAPLAVDYLVREKGYDSLIGYVKLAATADGPTAFMTAFGVSIDQFSAAFQTYLKGQLAKQP